MSLSLFFEVTMEKRIAAEVRAQGRKLIGYAAVFDSETRIGTMQEVIRPGAFKDSLSAGGDVLALADHDSSRVLGRTKSGTLRLSEDARGLSFELDVPDTQTGRDVLALAERGDLGGMSFGFHVPEGGQSWQGSKRTLTKINLAEVSVVSAWPAYQQTTIEARKKPYRANKIRKYLETI